MSPVRILAAALALCAAAVAGCGLGPGKDEGDVELTVTRDYGTKVMLQKSDSIRESDTVIRLLDRNADISTRYGGGFIQSIDGLAGSQSGGRSSDWFFYVNGIESPIGSAQYDPSGGDRIWWDYRDWTAAMRVPAVVGSWPEPFTHGFQGKNWPTTVDCEASQSACQLVADRLHSAGIATAPPTVGGIRVVVGGVAKAQRRSRRARPRRLPERKRCLRSIRHHQEATARGAKPAGSARRKHWQGRRADCSSATGRRPPDLGGDRD